MNSIKLLDCTLRDGGHVVQGKFGEQTIKSIVSNLVKAKMDIIEIGFLWSSATDKDTARFENIAKVKKYLPKDLGESKISLMADNVDLTNLEPCDGTVEFIRLSFRKNELEWVKKTAEIVKSKGYKVYINPIHGSAISDKEYIDIIQMVNELKPFGFAIVDTFGAMRQDDLGRIYYLVENNLNKDIELGIHLHENLGLSYSLAQYILQIVTPGRKVVIDGSLYGMGKIPGNLCIEQLMDHLNIRYEAHYATEPVYDSIDQFIMPFYHKYGWGYSIPYALSAQCGVHRTYAEYLSNKERLKTKDIRRLLKTIDRDNAETFNKELMEKKYKEYMNVSYDDSESISKLSSALDKYNSVIVIAPGSSIKNFVLSDDIKKGACIITVNFEYAGCDADYNFYSNAKRIVYASNLDMSKMIITSNLADDFSDAAYVISRNELVYHNDNWSDDSTIMLLNLLKRLGKKNVKIAGFDGFTKQKNNFYSEQYERHVREYDYDVESRKFILKTVYLALNIEFLTESAYK